MFRRDRSYNVGLGVATAVAAKLREDPAPIIAKARGQLPRIQEHVRGEAVRWVDEWATLLNGPLDELEHALVRDDQHGASLRSVAPFAGVLDWDERVAALRSAIPNFPDVDDAATHEMRRKIAAL